MSLPVVIEKASANCPAYVPDLPGSAAAGATPEEAERGVGEAIRFHLEGLRDDGLAVPGAGGDP